MRKVFLLLSVIASYSYAQYATFTPQTYQPIQQDYSILQRSLEQIERRQNEANEQYNKLQIMLAEYGAKLYNDEITMIWFDEYKKDIRNTFNSLSVIGWGEAKDYAIRQQGEIACDPELAARIRTANEYIAKRKAIEERTDMDWKQKNEWKENNPYYFVPIKDNQGNIISGRLGSKVELEEYKRKVERLQREAKERTRQLEKREKERVYQMEHPFDDFDYSSYSKIINYPVSGKCPDGMRITKVALSSTETRVEISLIPYSYNQWCCIQWNTYIKASNSGKLSLIKADNIAISPSKVVFNKPGERLKFALIFPPLPPKTKSFTIEEPIRNGWKFKNIRIN